MTLASSQGNQPAFARLPTRLPTTAGEWSQFIQALQSWQRGIQTIEWQAPTLQNGWVNYANGGFPSNAAFYQDASGIVHLRGLVSAGIIGDAIFTLPAGYIPPYEVNIPTVALSSFANVRIVGAHEGGTPGQVIAGTGSNTWFSLDGISFSTQ